MHYTNLLFPLPLPTIVAGGRACTAVSVCLSVFFHDVSENDAADITKLDVQMFHDESWKPIYLGQGSNGHELTGMGLDTLVSAGFFWFI